MQLKFRRESPSSSRWRIPFFIALALLVILHVHRRNAKANNTHSLRPAASAASDELLPVYDLPPTFTSEPTHLTPVDPTTLIPKGTYTIDVAHRKGYLHTGHVLYVMDADGKVLFLQRSSSVKTCPGTWSILGEHANVGEDARETVVRGVEEELGFIAVNFGESQFSGAWTADFHPANKMKETLRVTIQNATEFPLYYIRHYGPRLDNRIDRQLTYLWLVQFPKKHKEIQWNLDHEVANHKWVSLDEVGHWLSEDATRDKTKVVQSSVGGVRDDGPDEGDFCHRTIRSLYEAGLMNML